MTTLAAGAAWALLCAAGPGPAAPETVDLAVPRIRLEITIDGRPPQAAWAAFLDRLFDHFDTDGDGFLSAAEAARVIPLPGRDGKPVAPDFTGKVDRAGFRALRRKAGFTPVVVAERRADADARRLGEVLFRRLDRDGNGSLSRVELERATALLRRFDRDEDGLLTAGELLASDPAGREAPAEDKSAPTGGESVPVLPISLGRDNAVALTDGGKDARLGKPDPSGGVELTLPGSVCRIALSAFRTADGFQQTREFHTVSFRTASADGRALDRSAVEQDPAVQVLSGVFDAADRNRDGKLDAAELERLFDLIEMGVRSQTVVTVTDRGRNLFDLLDADGDGRLDYRELNAAARLLDGPLKGREAASRGDLPRRLLITIEQGPAGRTWGPVRIAAPNVAKATAPSPRATGPRWFAAMDRNGDGFLTPDEFLGSAELFGKLDLDGDGVIGGPEALKADEKVRP